MKIINYIKSMLVIFIVILLGGYYIYKLLPNNLFLKYAFGYIWGAIGYMSWLDYRKNI